MPRHVVRIKPDGTTQFIDSPALAGLKAEGATTARRASHVEPHGRVLRLLFHAARRLFGEAGAVAAFTRAWPCLWRVNLRPSGGPVMGVLFPHRADAIAAEVAWLQANRLGSPTDRSDEQCATCKHTGPATDFDSHLDPPHRLCPMCGSPYVYTVGMYKSPVAGYGAITDPAVLAAVDAGLNGPPADIHAVAADQLAIARAVAKLVNFGPLFGQASAAKSLLDDRELGTVLAALRYWQREGWISEGHEHGIASDGGRLVPLDKSEIDALCDRLSNR